MAPPAPSKSGAAEVERRIAEVLGAGGRVALLLDYDGTLREFEPDPAGATPTAAVRELLDALARDRRFDVTIISGRTPDDLERFFDGYPFCLIAEHGATVLPCGSGVWERLDGDVDYTWRGEMLGAFRAAAESTPGSFVEEKRTSLVWHYRRSDPAPAEAMARRLAEELSTLAAGRAIVVRTGRKIVEVTAAGVNKGSAVVHVLNRLPGPCDLVVVVGDDVTDESMYCAGITGLVSIKVGDGETKAQYRVDSPEELRRMLGRASQGR